jgi:ferritin-like metal-binding protein YciE
MSQEDLKEELITFMQNAHAMEEKSLQTLQAAVAVAGDPQLESLYNGHIVETREHLRLLEERLDALGASRSLTKDLAARLAALGLGAGAAVQPDTPAKLIPVAYAFESFEIASYELLKRVAERAGDRETARSVETILVNERQAAAKLAASYDLALRAAEVA